MNNSDVPTENDSESNSPSSRHALRRGLRLRYTIGGIFVLTLLFLGGGILLFGNDSPRSSPDPTPANTTDPAPANGDEGRYGVTEQLCAAFEDSGYETLVGEEPAQDLEEYQDLPADSADTMTCRLSASDLDGELREHHLAIDVRQYAAASSARDEFENTLDRFGLEDPQTTELEGPWDQALTYVYSQDSTYFLFIQDDNLTLQMEQFVHPFDSLEATDAQELNSEIAEQILEELQR